MATNMEDLNSLAKANQITPTTTAFDESKGVAGRVNSLTQAGSPLFDAARTRAAQTSARRGLMNSSIGAQAGEQAVIETATPIANADANLFQQQNLANQAAQNQASISNANNALTAGIRGRELDVNDSQFGRSLFEQARQFDTTTAQRDSQFGVTAGQAQQQIDAQREQFAQSLGMTQKDLELKRDQLTQQQQQFLAQLDLQQQELSEKGRQFDASREDNLAMFDAELSEKARQFGLSQAQTMALAEMDVNTKLQMAELEASYKNQIQSSQNISNAWGTMMGSIADIQNNPNLDEATKAALIENNIQSFQSFTNFWQKATGGSVDVSDLLAFEMAQAPGGGSNPSNPAEAQPGDPNYAEGSGPPTGGE